MSGPESKFQHKITERFDKLIRHGKPLYYFVKEAGSIRGIPDLVLCANGQFMAWEVKTSQEEARRSSGRIVLQKYTVDRIQRAHGSAMIVYPENLEEAFELLEVFLLRGA